MNVQLLCSALVISLMLDIGILMTSNLFMQESYELIKEYENVSEIYEERVTYCGKCPPAIQKNKNFSYSFGRLETVGCMLGPDFCYQENAERYAALLDNHHLLVHSNGKDFEKYHDEYNFDVIGKWKKYIEEREMILLEYPQSWVVLTILALCFTLIKIVGQVTIGLIADIQKVEVQKFWIGTFVVSFLLLLSMFVMSIVNKTNCACPGIQYGSKYTSDCVDGGKTWGRWFYGLLGANMFLHFFLSCYIIKYGNMKQEESPHWKKLNDKIGLEYFRYEKI